MSTIKKQKPPLTAQQESQEAPRLSPRRAKELLALVLMGALAQRSYRAPGLSVSPVPGPQSSSCQGRIPEDGITRTCGSWDPLSHPQMERAAPGHSLGEQQELPLKLAANQSLYCTGLGVPRFHSGSQQWQWEWAEPD